MMIIPGSASPFIDQFEILEYKLPELTTPTADEQQSRRHQIWSSLPALLQLIILLMITTFLVIIAIYILASRNVYSDADYTIFDHAPSDQTNGWIEFTRWIIVVYVALSGHFIAKYSAIFVPQLIAFVLKRNKQVFSPSVLYFLEMTSQIWQYLCYNTFAFLCWLTSLQVMSYPSNILSKRNSADDWIHLPWQFYAERLLLITLISSLFLTLEKIFLHMIGKEFNRKIYCERIQKCMYSLWTINVLKKAAFLLDYTYYKDFKNFEKIWKAKPYPYESSDLMSTFILENFVKLGKKSGERKQTMARKIFNFLTNPKTPNKLYIDDIRPFFRKSEVEKVFSVLDHGNAGDISINEFVKAVDEIYLSRAEMIKILLTNSDVVGRLDNFMLCLLVILICLIVFPTVGFSPSETLIPVGVSLGPTIVACTLIFGETIKSIFAAIIFLFATHPYDVGDRVYMDQCNYFVRRIGLFSTTFERWDGFTVYIPNSVLSTKAICNVRRTGYQTQRVEIVLPASTSPSNLQQLEHRLFSFVHNESRDYVGVRCCRYEIREMNQLVMILPIKHRYSYQDGFERYLRNNKFMKFLLSAIKDLGIEYYSTIRTVELIAPEEYHSTFSPIK